MFNVKHITQEQLIISSFEIYRKDSETTKVILVV